MHIFRDDHVKWQPSKIEHQGQQSALQSEKYRLYKLIVQQFIRYFLDKEGLYRSDRS